MKISKAKWIPIGLVAGIAIMMFNNTIMKKDTTTALKEPEQHVFSTQITRQNIAPQIKGYGNIAAKNTWQAISEVQGKIIYLNPKLQRGSFIAANELLLKIDPSRYQISLNNAQASLANIAAEKDQLDIEKLRLQRSLKLEKNNLALEKKELTRLTLLRKKGTVSQSNLEQQERVYLNKQLSVSNTQAQVNQLPYQLNALNAQLAQAQSQVEQAELDLSHTIITMPFSGRIIDVTAEKQQVVNIGATMILAHDVSKLEIEAKMPARQLAKLVTSVKANHERMTNLTQVPDIAIAKLTAKVILRNAKIEREWQGKVTRILGEIDNRMGTAGLVVEVDFDFVEFIKDINSNDLPLVSGMFVEVVIDGYPQEHLTVPLAALHSDSIYLIDENQRLQIQPIDVAFIREQEVAIIGAGLKAGQEIVVSDVLPLTNGLKLKATAWQKDK